MSTRYNTGNPIESTDVRDMSDNAKNFDEFSVSTQPTFADRFGVARKTLPSLISKAEQDIYYAVINAGFQPAQFDFVTGGTLVDGERNKAVFNPSPTGDNNWYAWQGAFQKIIAPNSTPATSGGFGDNAWKPVTNNILAPTVMESIRRSYAEAGYNVVGTFQAGFTYVNANDVGIDPATGKGYTGPAGPVDAGTDPTSGGFVDRSVAGDNFTYDSLRAYTGSGTGRVTVIGRSNIFDGGQGTFFLRTGDTTTPDNDCTVIVDALGRRWRRDNTSHGINVACAGAIGAGGDDYSAIAKAVAAAGKRGTVYIPRGFNCGTSQTINLNDTLCSIVGDGPEVSKITALAGLNTAIISQLNTASDGGDTFERIEGVGIYGNYSSTLIGINQRLTSRSSMRNVLVQGCRTGLRQVDNFVHMSEQVEIKDCKTCLHLVGSNHGSEYIRLGAIGFGDSFGGAGEGILIECSGADNLQSAIAFRGCDIEFGVGDGVVCASTGTILFDGCYMEKVRGRMFVVNDGDVVVSGGEYIIYDAAGHLVDPVGGNGRIYFDDKASLTSDGVTRIYPSLIKSGGAGRVYFKSSSLFTRMLTTNNGALPNNLGRLGRPAPYLKPQGRHFGANAFSGGATQTSSGDAKTVTCNAAGNIGVYQQMTLQPLINESAALVVKYSSNIILQVTTVAAAGQSAPITTIGSLPNSGGSVQLAVFPNARITDAAQQWLEFWKGTQWQVGDTLTLHEVWWCSGDSIRNGELSLG